jgi:hypothetical protein
LEAADPSVRGEPGDVPELPVDPFGAAYRVQSADSGVDDSVTAAEVADDAEADPTAFFAITTARSVFPTSFAVMR